MTEDQGLLLEDAHRSLEAARLLVQGGYPGYAAARAYDTMFYVAEALLEGEGLSFSKHSAVIAAFGRHFARTGKVPAEFHKHLLVAQELRHSGDYGHDESITAEQAPEQIERAERFLAVADQRTEPPARAEE